MYGRLHRERSDSLSSRLSVLREGSREERHFLTSALLFSVFFESCALCGKADAEERSFGSAARTQVCPRWAPARATTPDRFLHFLRLTFVGDYPPPPPRLRTHLLSQLAADCLHQCRRQRHVYAISGQVQSGSFGPNQGYIGACLERGARHGISHLAGARFAVRERRRSLRRSDLL